MKSDLSNIMKIFDSMSKDGFNIKEELKWGFYFFDSDKKKLSKVYSELEEKNYKFEGIKKTDDGYWRLFITKIEILSPEKLHKRNLAFNELADYFSVALYDGWDVERVE